MPKSTNRTNKKSGSQSKTKGSEKRNPSANSSKFVLAAEPYPVFLLSVDVGKASGYAFHHPTRGLLDYGELNLAQDYSRVKDLVFELMMCAENYYPLLCLENAMWGRQVTGPTMGVWKYAALSAGLLPKQIVGVHVNTWRRLLYGDAKQTTEQAKVKAIHTCKKQGITGVTHNTAEAILMGSVAQRLNTVWDKVPKRAQKELLNEMG